ncbi:unnamed protein product [Durusdinium trenchii]|uniref:Uncharacterized protein n=1 Tax=Durusdinium trenchii TaxID=1381693 RepID=A0ABP0LKI4_9DINO
MKASVFLLLAQAAGLTFHAEDAVRPTTKVVKLLQGMQEQLDSEAKADEETYDKFKCWCHENTVAREKAVKEAEMATTELKDRVEILLAKSDRLKAEVETTEDEVAKNQAALDTATHLRRQQNKEFTDDLERLNSDLSGVTSAITAMAVAGEGAFLQSKETAARPLREILGRHAAKLNMEDRQAVESFLQRGDGVDTVKGVLEGLKDDFTADLVKIKDDEATSTKQYEALAAAKTEEIQAGIKQIETKKEEKANADEERAIKKQEIKDTEAILGTDVSFVAEVKQRCADMDAQWDERQKTRAEETTAISKAVEILDADEAHANFAKTFSPSFLQESSSSRVQAAAKALSKAKDPRVLSLAMQMKIDKFTNVKKAMDDMVFALKKEQEDEVTQKEFCVDELRKNQLQTEEKTRNKDALVAKEQAIDLETPTNDLKTLHSEISEMQKQLQLAGQNREKENTEFQQMVEEQRKTQGLLKEALKVLAKFYDKEAFLQGSSHAPEVPGGFKDYKANGKSFGVMTMLQQLVDDAAAMEAEAVRAEKSAQSAYEAFAKDTTVSIAKKEASIMNKKAHKAKLEQTLVQTRQSREGHERELETLEGKKMDLHESCDWLLKNFDARQSAREEEVDSVKKAKAILSGASFAEIQLD